MRVHATRLPKKKRPPLPRLLASQAPEGGRPGRPTACVRACQPAWPCAHALGWQYLGLWVGRQGCQDPPLPFEPPAFAHSTEAEQTLRQERPRRLRDPSSSSLRSSYGWHLPEAPTNTSSTCHFRQYRPDVNPDGASTSRFTDWAWQPRQPQGQYAACLLVPHNRIDVAEEGTRGEVLPAACLCRRGLTMARRLSRQTHQNIKR